MSGRRWTPQEIAVLRKLAHGDRRATIAETVAALPADRQPSAVYQRLLRMGLLSFFDATDWCAVKYRLWERDRDRQPRPPRPAPPRGHIACLTCTRPFASQGPHNRRCDACRAQSMGPCEFVVRANV